MSAVMLRQNLSQTSWACAWRRPAKGRRPLRLLPSEHGMPLYMSCFTCRSLEGNQTLFSRGCGTPVLDRDALFHTPICLGRLWFLLPPAASVEKLPANSNTSSINRSLWGQKNSYLLLSRLLSCSPDVHRQQSRRGQLCSVRVHHHGFYLRT